MVCLPDNTGSTLFASAQVSEYALKRAPAPPVSESAPGLNLASHRPERRFLVRSGRRPSTTSKDFYQRFFAAVGKTLAEMQAGKVLSAPAALPPGCLSHNLRRKLPPLQCWSHSGAARPASPSRCRNRQPQR